MTAATTATITTTTTTTSAIAIATKITIIVATATVSWRRNNITEVDFSWPKLERNKYKMSEGEPK